MGLNHKMRPLLLALLIIVRRLVVIVIRDSDRSGVDVHVNHLDTEELLYL